MQLIHDAIGFVLGGLDISIGDGDAKVDDGLIGDNANFGFAVGREKLVLGGGEQTDGLGPKREAAEASEGRQGESDNNAAAENC